MQSQLENVRIPIVIKIKREQHLRCHSLLIGTLKGINPLRVFPARRPKGFAFRYPSSHHYATKQLFKLFCLTLRALSGFESLLS